MEKGISGCSTLTKLSLQDLPLQCASAACASVRAAMALQASLGEVAWIRCSFRSKSNIGVTVLVCCVWCVHGCVVRDRGRGGRDCVCVLCMRLLVRMGACLCVRVSFEMYLHCVCPSLVNVATRCVGSESARVHVLLL